MVNHHLSVKRHSFNFRSNKKIQHFEVAHICPDTDISDKSSLKGKKRRWVILNSLTLETTV